MSAPPQLDWRELAARASRLDERLRGEVIPDEGVPAVVRVVDARLIRWRELVAGGDEARFVAVLNQRGLDKMGARRVLGPMKLSAGTPLPRWTRTARRIAARALQNASRCPTTVTASDFRVVFSPSIQFARETLRRKVGHASCQHLLTGAHRSLEDHLLQRLERVGKEALELEFCIHQSLEGSWQESDSPPEEIARLRFIQNLLSRGGLAELFRLFPALARLCAELVDAWVATNVEFLRRLARDRPWLRERFFHEDDCHTLGPICTLEAGVGDEHRGGRSVLILGFRSRGVTRRLVYKPRDLGVDLAWFDLLKTFNAEGLLQPFRSVRTWPRRQRYGWMEFVAAEPQRDQQARARYGWRAGALACLFHALGGTDGHRGNVVAAGDQPVLVDLETLLHGPDPGQGSLWPLAHTVFRTALLPLPADPKETGLRLGGKRWTFPPAFGSSGMSPELEVAAGDLLAGFKAMLQLLTAERPTPRLAKRLRSLAQRQVRRVLLPTALYDVLRHRSLAVGCLREGIDRSLEFEFLRREGLGPDRREPWIAAEVRALEWLDIPYFAVRPGRAGEGDKDSHVPEWLGELGAAAIPAVSRETLKRHLEAQAALLEETYLNP